MRRPGVRIHPRPPHSKGLASYFESRRSSFFQSKWDAGERSDCSSAPYLTSALLATRSSATISLSRRDGVFTWINFNSIVSCIVVLNVYDGDNQMKEKDDDIAHPGRVSKPEKIPNFGPIQ